jgi:hypothetical protein
MMLLSTRIRALPAERLRNSNGAITVLRTGAIATRARPANIEASKV